MPVGAASQQQAACPMAGGLVPGATASGSSSISVYSSAPSTSGRPALDPAYETALEHTRRQRYDSARDAFEELLDKQPQHEKAWISFAQARDGAVLGAVRAGAGVAAAAWGWGAGGCFATCACMRLPVPPPPPGGRDSCVPPPPPKEPATPLHLWLRPPCLPAARALCSGARPGQLHPRCLHRAGTCVYVSLFARLQMSKKRFAAAGPALAQQACREVLQRGVTANPQAPKLWQVRGGGGRSAAQTSL